MRVAYRARKGIYASIELSAPTGMKTGVGIVEVILESMKAGRPSVYVFVHDGGRLSATVSLCFFSTGSQFPRQTQTETSVLVVRWLLWVSRFSWILKIHKNWYIHVPLPSKNLTILGHLLRHVPTHNVQKSE